MNRRFNSSSGAHGPLLICLGLALLARLMAFDWFDIVSGFHGDESFYQKSAMSIFHGRGLDGSLRPPLYPAFIATVYRVFGQSPDALRLVQIGLSLLSIAALYRIVFERFGRRAALISGLAYSLAPAAVHYTHFLWSESFATTLLVLLLWAFHHYERTESRESWLVVAGLLLGLNALTRETWFMIGLGLALWIVWRERPAWRYGLARAAILTVCMIAVVAPWTIRNYRLHDAFVLVSTGRWYPIFHGNSLNEDDWMLGTVRIREHRQSVRHLSELEQDAYWRGVSRELIAEQQPWWILKKAARNTSLLLQIRTQAVRFIDRGWYAPEQRWRAHAVMWSSIAGHILLVALGMTALWFTRDGWLQSIVIAILLYTLLIHILAVASSRYLVPLIPLLALYVGPWLAGKTGSYSRARLIGAATCLLAFALALIARWGHDSGPALQAIASLGTLPVE